LLKQEYNTNGQTGNDMKNIFTNLTLRNKLIASFILVLSMQIAVGLSFTHKLSRVAGINSEIVNEVQPTLIAAKQLANDQLHLALNLGLYMLDKQDYHLESFEKNQVSLQGNLKILKQSESIQNDHEVRKLLDVISNRIDQLIAFKPEVIELAGNDQINIPATKYASDEINPFAMEISQHLSEMIQIEEEEEASEVRKAILADLNNLRYAWSNLINEMRLYLAFRAPTAKSNLLLHKENVEKLIQKTQTWNDALTFEQADGIEQVGEKTEHYFNNLDTLFQIHEGDKWRMDAWIVRNRITPTLAQLHKDINQLVGKLESISAASKETIKSLHINGRNETILSILAGVVLLSLLGWLMVRNIQSQLGADPKQLLKITQAIAEGDLTTKLDNAKMTGVYKSVICMQKSLHESIEKEHRIAEVNGRIKEALDNVSGKVMVADTKGKIIYTNKAIEKMMHKIEPDMKKALPEFDSNNLVGSNFDQFHKNPSHQRSLLSELQETYMAEVPIGDLQLRIVVNPVFDANNVRIGTVAEWFDRTQEVAIENDIQDIVSSAMSGDLNRRIDLSIQEGFTRRLSENINQLVDVCGNVIDETVQVMSAVAHGDLTRKIKSDYEGSFGQLKDDVNATIAKLTEVMGEINNSATSVLSSSQEIAQGNTDLSQRTEQQASSLEETASSMEEMTSTVRQNADNARQANQLASSTREQAEQGGQVVSKAITAMTGITESSNKIAAIIGVIDEIAFQTNLLALNAAVEAARAGEQGRGFAVVASEVRNLAGRSATAAKEIKELIEDSVVKVEEGSKLVDASGQTLDEIMNSVKKVSDIIAEIAAASQEQSEGIEQVNKAIAQMDEMTQQNAALVEEAAAASESMGEQAGNLSKMVGFFKTGQSAASYAGPERRKSERPWAEQATTKVQPQKPVSTTRSAKAATGSADESEWEEF